MSHFATPSSYQNVTVSSTEIPLITALFAEGKGSLDIDCLRVNQH